MSYVFHNVCHILNDHYDQQQGIVLSNLPRSIYCVPQSNTHNVVVMRDAVDHSGLDYVVPVTAVIIAKNGLLIYGARFPIKRNLMNI